MKLTPTLSLVLATLTFGACDRADLIDDIAREVDQERPGAHRPGKEPPPPPERPGRDAGVPDRKPDAGRPPRPDAGPSRPDSCRSELHVVGVYEPRDKGRPVSVLVDRPGRHTVVLSAYESVAWDLRPASPETIIDRVILVGYHQQKVISRLPVKIESRSYDERNLGDQEACGYSWPYNGGGCDTRRLLAGIEKSLGQPVVSFSGTYQGNGFILRADDKADIGTSGGYESYQFVRPSKPCLPPPPPPPAAQFGCVDKSAVGYYEGSSCNGPFIQTKGITCGEALENCMINAKANPEMVVFCTFDGRPIFKRGGRCEAPPAPRPDRDVKPVIVE